MLQYYVGAGQFTECKWHSIFFLVFIFMQRLRESNTARVGACRAAGFSCCFHFLFIFVSNIKENKNNIAGYCIRVLLQSYHYYCCEMEKKLKQEFFGLVVADAPAPLRGGWREEGGGHQ